MHKSDKKKLGTLLMLSTHIGQIDDIPNRSIKALQSADLLIFEEDRPARQALKAARVHREYLKFSEHFQKETLIDLKKALLEGKTVAYMSDQGSPSFADPGQALLKVAYSLGAQVKVVPGPCSLSAAISACPYELNNYFFAGFLSRSKEKRERDLNNLSKRKEAFVVMDTPYRLEALLHSCKEILPKGRKGFLAIDISGENENYIAGTFTELCLMQKKLPQKLNFILIVSSQ